MNFETTWPSSSLFTPFCRPLWGNERKTLNCRIGAKKKVVYSFDKVPTGPRFSWNERSQFSWKKDLIELKLIQNKMVAGELKLVTFSFIKNEDNICHLGSSGLKVDKIFHSIKLTCLLCSKTSDLLNWSNLWKNVDDVDQNLLFLLMLF